MRRTSWITAALATALLVGCGEPPAQRAAMTDVKPGVATALANIGQQSVDIGDPIKVYAVPFTLASVPTAATLHLNFKMLSNGFCPITYVPTEVSLNNKSLATLDFRELSGDSDNDIRLRIPAGRLKVGENILSIRTGQCRYAIDAMRLNALVLTQ